MGVDLRIHYSPNFTRIRQQRQVYQMLRPRGRYVKLTYWSWVNCGKSPSLGETVPLKLFESTSRTSNFERRFIDGASWPVNMLSWRYKVRSLERLNKVSGMEPAIRFPSRSRSSSDVSAPIPIGISDILLFDAHRTFKVESWNKLLGIEAILL